MARAVDEVVGLGVPVGVNVLRNLPHIGSVPLQRLTAEDLDSREAELLANGRQNKGGRPLAPKTVRHVHVTIHAALNKNGR